MRRRDFFILIAADSRFGGFGIGENTFKNICNEELSKISGLYGKIKSQTIDVILKGLLCHFDIHLCPNTVGVLGRDAA